MQTPLANFCFVDLVTPHKRTLSVTQLLLPRRLPIRTLGALIAVTLIAMAFAPANCCAESISSESTSNDSSGNDLSNNDLLRSVSSPASNPASGAASSALTSTVASSASSDDGFKEGIIPDGSKGVAAEELPLDDEEVALETQKKQQAELSKAERELKFKASLASLLANKGAESIQAAVDLPRYVTALQLPELADLVQKPSLEFWIKVALLDTIAATRSKLAIPVLRFEYEQADEQVRPVAVEALGKLGHPDAIPLLSNILLDVPSAPLQVIAASALGKIRSRFSVMPLEKASRSAWFPITKIAADIALARLKGNLPDTISTNIQLGRRALLNYKGTPYYFYAPSLRLPNHPKPRLLVCVHDGNYDFTKLFKYCYEAGKTLQVAVLVPLWDPMRYPEYGTFNTRGPRPDTLLLELVDHLAKVADLEARELFLFGNGVGGDFVSRFVAAYPEHVARAAFMANSPIVPDYNQFFPFGFKLSPRAPDLKFDAVKLIKTEQAIIASRLTNYKKSSEAFQFYRAHAQQRGTIASTAFREVKYTDDLQMNFRIALNFLFAAN